MSELKPIGVLVTGQLLPELAARGGFVGLIQAACVSAPLGVEGEAPLKHRPTFVAIDAMSAAALPAASELSGVVITGSPASVMDEAPWMQRAMAWLRQLARARTPVLGLCFGHQLLGRAFGGEVAVNPRGREVGTTELSLTPGSSLAQGPLAVNMSHRDTVLTLGPGAEVLAYTAREPHAAVAFTETTLGLQFHPEFDAEVTRAYIQLQAAALSAQGDDPERLLAATQDTPKSAALLRDWALSCCG